MKGNVIVRALVLAFCVAVLVRSVRQAASEPPLYNWDMVSYVALAIAWEEDDPEVVHRRTYEALADELPPKVFQALTVGNIVDERFEDWRVFHEFLPFHRGRVLYTMPIYLAHEWGGVEWTRATWLLSNAAWFALACLICAWCVRALGFSWGLSVGTLLAHAPWLVTQMNRSVPDVEAAFLACLGLFLLIELRKDVLAAFFLSIAIFVRPDSILLPSFLVLTFLFARGDGGLSRKFLGVWFGVTWLAHFVLAQIAGSYSWWIVFSTGMTKNELRPSQVTTQPNWNDYTEILSRKIEQFPFPGYYLNFTKVGSGVAESTLPLVFVGIIFAGLALARRSVLTKGFERYRVVLWALLATSIAQWALWPRLGDRFFTVLFVCVPLVLLCMASALTKNRDQ